MIKSFDSNKAKISKTSFVAENATLIGKVTLEEDSSIWYGAVLRGDSEGIRIGYHSNIQDNCIIHADRGQPCLVGDRVTVGHGAILHSCEIGFNTLIGMGAIILNGAKIGENCIIGAGTLVTKNTIIPDGSLVIGSPGKVVRQLTKEEIQDNNSAANEYVQLKDKHRS